MKYFLIIAALLFIWAYFIEPNLLVIKKFQNDKLGDCKIIFASDFHIAKSDKKRLQKIVNTINELEPDLVLLGGDYIKGHDGKDSMPIEEQVEFFKQIEAPKISVLGNHDGWFDKKLVRDTLKTSGITVLENENVKFGNIYIAGVEDIQTGKPDTKKALQGTGNPRILLSHSPDIYYEVNEKVDLILTGHVHGGQVRIPFWGAIIVPSKYGTKFSQGLINETQNKMLISKGLGTSILSIRFCAIPEIIVIN